MRFLKPSYSRLQFYAIPYITECFYAGSAVIFVILIIVNIALVGNDVVTEFKDTPYFTHTKWWAPKWLPGSMTIPTIPGPCQPLTLPQQSASIRTNSTVPIFFYTLVNGLGVFPDAKGMEEPRWYNEPHYHAEPLKNCTVQNITALFNFQDRGHKLTAHIICDIDTADAETPPSLKLSTTFSRTANTDLGTDDIMNFISSYNIPQFADISKAQAVLLPRNVTALTVLGLLDAIGSDLLKAMWAQKWSWKLTGRGNQWPDQAVVKWASKVNCTSERRCRTIGEGIEGIDIWYSNTRGSQDFDPEYFAPMNTTIYNYFVAFRDALYLNLGHFDQRANVFLNIDVFKSNILSDPFLETIAGDVINITRPPPNTRPYSSDEFWRTCTWGWGCLNGTWTNALLNRGPDASSITNALPLSSLQSRYPTIINQKFMCPVFKRKQAGALLVSVFVDDWSATALMSLVHSSPTEIEESESAHRQHTRHLSSGWPSPYATSFDAHCIPHCSVTTVPATQQPNPVPDYIFVRTPRKEDELPPGARSPGSPGAFAPKPDAGTLSSIAPGSQLSLNRTISRDTTNTSQAARGFGEHGCRTLSPPRVVIRTSRSSLSSKPRRKPHHIG
ncbi:unnamed protein product [Rhizoctonia solani]|uniref:Transmembrane protein n=1 Tax=Rhizoctonia solani TaxID=456999 RepID=A0A8H3BPP7_9AGAM|nr:unnamed protein product [Rhizoctonia solani]